MLLLHQVGNVKIGEVVRYTVTYTPSQDRILPPPERLHVRIRNTSAVALRAAFVHGPYTLSVAAYPAAFDPNQRFANPRRYGVPEFEPMLKAGGSWECELVVPDDIRQGAGTGRQGGAFANRPGEDKRGAAAAAAEDASATWVVEISSQVIFSTSAAVGYELVVARDRKSLSLSSSLPVVGGHSHVPQPGRVSDHQQSIRAVEGHHAAQPRGVFSRALALKVEDTATLWNTPRLPGWDDAGHKRVGDAHTADDPVESMVTTGDPETEEEEMPRKQKRVHLVVLTHGLHSNLGADMLFIKESIDAAAKQAKIDAKERRARERASKRNSRQPESQEPSEEHDDSTKVDDHKDEDDDDEEVIVRGYSGNATKTERGIKYLGKRLARYVLSMTYPDQPCLPLGKGAGEGIAQNFGGDVAHEFETKAAHAHKHGGGRAEGGRETRNKFRRPYKVTSVSFIAHSLGGLVQTYAVAYIQKHSPHFFELIEPINFICLASPFLGLSNENPVYIRFALDFGLVGRTGKDLGLTWRAPTIARNGWGAIVGNLGETAQKKMYGESQPESKPLLRILPTGPAHTALKKFRNRTAYSNVVNDGIVPLRTSCLLFLDWQGLGRVEKARRDAGLVETMVGFGWGELTGANTAAPRSKQKLPVEEEQQQQTTDSGTATPGEDMFEVPQPNNDALMEDDRASLRSIPTPYSENEQVSSPELTMPRPLSGFFNLFKSSEAPKAQVTSSKQRKAFRRGQTLNLEDSATTTDSSADDTPRAPRVTAGDELGEAPQAPPRTTFFESAGDLLNPKMPEVEFIIDPSKRPRTIFHDRVYHPADIPPAPMKKRTTTSSSFMRKKFNRSNSQQTAASGSSSPYPSPAPTHEDSMNFTGDGDGTRQPAEVVDSSDMRVEEKIARGYHRDLAWRKVLVKLEPDAHNNIFVRRMFVNAYGWPVVKHLVDSHFSDSAVARMRTADEYLGERALDMNQPPNEHGGETKDDPADDDDDDDDDDDGEDGEDDGEDGEDDGEAADVSGEKQQQPELSSEREAQEARDKVPELPSVRESDWSASAANTPRPTADRVDSMTWSDRDWGDSDNDSELDMGGGSSEGHPHSGSSKANDGGDGRASSPTWNWTEKIVGKGGSGRPKQPEKKHEDGSQGSGSID